MAAQKIPDGYSTVTVYLVVKDAVEALSFYGKAFGATTLMRMPAPGGGTIHAEMQLGSSRVMLTDENLQWGMKSPLTIGGSPATMHLYVEDCDAVFARATEAGCEIVQPLMDAFWGDRMGKVKDPFGHEWGIATHLEDLTPEEIGVRQQAFFKEMEEPGGAPCE